MAELSLPTSLNPELPLRITDSLSKRVLQLEQQAVRKLDYTILPIITLLLFSSFLARANIGNARVAGLQKDLDLTDKQYEICLSVFLVTYIIAELLSSFFIKKVGPRLLLPAVVTVWGIMTSLQGFVTSFAGLAIVRAFLGLVEGPLNPGVIIYLSSFYIRKDLSLRIAIPLSTVSLSGAFSGLLAAAIEKMNGIGGKPGWAWIFILEGLLSVLIGIIGFFLVPSTPRDSLFLTASQKEIIMRRLERDRPSMTLLDSFSFEEVARSPGSPHVVIVTILTFMHGTIIYGLAFFLPFIVSQLGFSPNKTQLLSVGPFATGFFVALISAFFSDRYRIRGIVIILNFSLAVAGFAFFLSAEHKFASYSALYLMAPGLYGAAPILSAWMANNSEPHYRRAMSIALYVLADTSGAIVSIWTFPTKDGPKFRRTTIMNLTFSVLVVVGSLMNMAYLLWRNKVKQHPGVRAKLLENLKYELAAKEGDIDGRLRPYLDLGDRHPDFLYTL